MKITRRIPVEDTGDIIASLPPLPHVDGVEFRHIPGFTGYIAGDDGSIWSSLFPNKKRRVYGPWHLKSSWANEFGHLLVSLKGDDGKEHRPFVHSLVLLSFIGPAPKSHEACHFPDRTPSNNRLTNLRWGTRRENMDDARKHGTLAKGERHGQAKMNALKVLATKLLRGSGWTQRDVAALLGVSQATVSAIDNGQRWNDDDAA